MEVDECCDCRPCSVAIDEDAGKAIMPLCGLSLCSPNLRVDDLLQLGMRFGECPQGSDVFKAAAQLCWTSS
eukprot:1508287-Prorocentrum_lima.AAC.1